MKKRERVPRRERGGPEGSMLNPRRTPSQLGGWGGGSERGGNEVRYTHPQPLIKVVNYSGKMFELGKGK